MAVDTGERAHEDDINHDRLTGLLNLRGLELELDRLAESAPGEFAICYVDLDNLKAVNDTEGHEAGNEHIKKAAVVLSQSVRTAPDDGTTREPDATDRPADIVSAARIGGDEFVVLLLGIKEHGQLDIVLARMRESLDLAGIPASLDGVVHEPGRRRSEFLDAADAGMAVNKAGRKKTVFESLPKRKRVAALLGERLMRYAGVNPPRQ